MTSVQPTDTWEDAPYPVKGSFSPFAEAPEAPFEPEALDPSELIKRVDLDQRLAEIGERLTLDIPGFIAFYGGPLQENTPAPSLSLGLVTHHHLSPSAQRTLKLSIGRFLRIPRICLGFWVPQNLRSEILRNKAGIDLLLEGNLVTGAEDPLASIGPQLAQSPAPQAALSELQNAFEALLRFPPGGGTSGPRLTPDPSDFHPQIGPVLVIEHLANSMLLKLGTYSPSLEKRQEVLRQNYPVSPSRLKLLLWGLNGGIGAPPLDQVSPTDSGSSREILWQELRNLCLGLYVSIRFPEADMEIDAASHPIYKEVSLPKSRIGRWWRKLRGPRKTELGLDPYGLLLLALVLAKTGPDKENKPLCIDIADLLPNLGGGILAHPSWENLRKEAMSLQPMPPCFARDFLSAV